MRRFLLFPIRFYQYAISPMMASHCRHYPTCSQYALEAISRHGSLKGLYLSAKRLMTCHPWAEGGYDPVPDALQSGPAHASKCCSQVDPSSITTQTRQ